MASRATTDFGRESPGARSFIEPDVSTRIATAAPTPSSTAAWYGALSDSWAEDARADRSRRGRDSQARSMTGSRSTTAALARAFHRKVRSGVIRVRVEVYRPV